MYPTGKTFLASHYSIPRYDDRCSNWLHSKGSKFYNKDPSFHDHGGKSYTLSSSSAQDLLCCVAKIIVEYMELELR